MQGYCPLGCNIGKQCAIRHALGGERNPRLGDAEKTEGILRGERERLLADLERECATRLEAELHRFRRGWPRRFFGF